MSKILQLDPIVQQLDSLSLEQLLEVRKIVDALVTVKFSHLAKIEFHESTNQLIELENNKDDSVEKILELVNEWMLDESGYDEKIYPQIQAALNHNQK
ncbi:hypothetical protein VB711_12085 [Cronbergia sp. UHCC 0137]|uniref:hypothetical protein n=1 Tax=Cronbergia sp. UHCC 0137 TaxID=3110239 RepID=UPI002B21B545|nr:hypothetical protein [Cronbergia sp. UHCC 0137]MEA5618570.1 hypothetical protein [Cronbergia sp. UHCC 0137]